MVVCVCLYIRAYVRMRRLLHVRQSARPGPPRRRSVERRASRRMCVTSDAIGYC